MSGPCSDTLRPGHEEKDESCAGRHRHGADNIQSGERVNFILWSVSETYRSSKALTEKNQDGFKML